MARAIHDTVVTTETQHSVELSKKELFIYLARCLATDGVQIGDFSQVEFLVGREEVGPDSEFRIEWKTRTVERNP